MTDLHIDVTELSSLARDLRKADPVLAREFGKAISKTGQVVAEDARTRAAGIFSAHMPKIGIRRRGASVRIQARGAPIVGLEEFGSTGNPDSIRHPVFGNWVPGLKPQPAHHFMQPAAAAHVDDLVRGAIQAVDDTFRSVGFH